MRHEFEVGDLVEITKPRLERGAKGRIDSVGRDTCVVKITSSGENFNMVSKIGRKISYPKNSLKGI